MKAIDQVPAGVASRLEAQAAASHKAAEGLYDNQPEGMRLCKFNGLVHLYCEAGNEWLPHIGRSAEVMARQWLDGLDSMRLA